MQLNLERPDYSWFLRGADGTQARVNDRVLLQSFIIAPDALIEDWPVRAVATMTPADLEPVLALNPELVVLGTGASQVFPGAAVMAACLSRGIGIEVMDNAAAARTFSVLAGEGRNVVAGFVFPYGGSRTAIAFLLGAFRGCRPRYFLGRYCNGSTGLPL